MHYRPYLTETLQKLRQHFELILFCDGTREVECKIIEQLDPKGDLFAFRLFKENCYVSEEGFVVKDLRIIDRNPASVSIVDNSTCSFGLQLANGIPILPFTGRKEDAELLFLSEYLMYLKDRPDVRVANKNHFKFQLLNPEFTIEQNKNLLFKADDIM